MNNIKGILDISIYKLYIINKKIKTVYYIKIRITYRKLFKLYIDLKRPYNPFLLDDNIYTAIVLDDWFRKSQILFFLSKDFFFESFIFLLKIIEIKSGKKLSKFRIDNDRKFINEAFDKFYKKRKIIFKFINPYTLK